MPDKRFYTKNGNFTIAEIISSCGGEVSSTVDTNLLIKDVLSLKKAGEGNISFFENKKYIEDFKNSKASACITYKEFEAIAPKNMAIIKSKNPYYTYSQVLQKFYGKDIEDFEIPHSANIDLDAEIAKNTQI